MSATNTGRELYFWFDCETTGLNPFGDTVLEVAWCFTDERLRMISPLRQRFTQISADSQALDPSDDLDWAESPMSDYVRAMHEKSGLREAWMEAYGGAPHSILTHPRDLFRLVAEDLDLIGATREDRLVLAGAGVSHFDDSVLAEAFDRFYPRRPVINGTGSPLGQWHYRCFDTSVALWVANARDQVDALARKLAEPPDPDGSETPLPFDLIECQQAVAPEAIHLLNFGPTGDGPGQFERSAAIGHRAADDVVWSLLDARALRYLTSGRR